jgi:hypothetical protein
MSPSSAAPRRVFAAVGSIALAVVCLALAPPTTAQGDRPSAQAPDTAAPFAGAAPCRAPFDRDPALFAAIAAGDGRDSGAPPGALPVCPRSEAGGGPPRRIGPAAAGAP